MRDEFSRLLLDGFSAAGVVRDDLEQGLHDQIEALLKRHDVVTADQFAVLRDAIARIDSRLGAIEEHLGLTETTKSRIPSEEQQKDST